MNQKFYWLYEESLGEIIFSNIKQNTIHCLDFSSLMNILKCKTFSCILFYLSQLYLLFSKAMFYARRKLIIICTVCICVCASPRGSSRQGVIARPWLWFHFYQQAPLMHEQRQVYFTSVPPSSLKGKVRVKVSALHNKTLLSR